MAGLHGGGFRAIMRRLEPQGERGIISFSPIDVPPGGPAELRFMVQPPRTLEVLLDQREAADVIFSRVGAAQDVRGYEAIYQGQKGPQHDDGLIKALGDCLVAIGPDSLSSVGAIPAAYTYIGQFIAHDISHMRVVDGKAGPNLVSPALDLRSLLADPVRTLLGPTHPGPDLNDLPRPDGRVPDIPDLRNDFNLAVAQVQVMLARLHLHLCAGVDPADPAAMQTTRNCFQHAVLHDYLPKIVGAEMARAVQAERKVVKPVLYPDLFLVPLEFALAFFRFGHGMVRGKYEKWVAGTGSVSPSDLWRTTHKGDLLPVKETWIMPWAAMLETNFARGFGPRLTRTFERVPAALIEQPQWLQMDGPENPVVNLAVETMLRGNRLGLATAQQLGGQIAGVLDADGGTLIDLCDPPELQQCLGGAAPELATFLGGEGRPFLDQTPLWFYTLLEAQRYAGGCHLGPMAGRIVAETIHAAIAADPEGIFGASKGFDPASACLVPPRPDAWFEAMAHRASLPLPT